MVVDTDESVRSSSRRWSSRFWRGLVAVVLVLAGGSWIAIQVQTDCEALARQAIFGYSDALNAGDAVLAADAFADTGDFVWYSDPTRVGDDARNRDSLSDYLADRIAQDVKLRILFFDFNAESPVVNGLGHFGLYAFNESWELISGKGAVSCGTGKVAVLSIGGS
jgi:hypothetical protein